MSKFEKGNRAAVGHDASKAATTRKNMLTQELISLLHEIDKTTGKQKKRRLVEELYKCAVGFSYKTLDAKGRQVTVQVPPNIVAIKEIFDRIDGKAPHGANIADGEAPIPFEVIRHVIVDSSGREIDSKVVDIKPN